MVVKEYKRTCTKCGKIWHSLASRESALKMNQVSGVLGSLSGCMQSCGTCGMCGGATQAQHNRNVDANTSELNRLRSCPECGSTAYVEEEIVYE